MDENDTLKMVKKTYDSSHAVWEMFSRLGSEDLQTLATLFTTLSRLDDGKAVSRYYLGLIDGVLQVKYQVCPSCEVVHTDENAEETFDRYLCQVETASGQTIKRPPKKVDEPLTPGSYL